MNGIPGAAHRKYSANHFVLRASLRTHLYGPARVILLFILAMLFAYLIDPLVKFLQRHSLFFNNLRGPAVVEVYLACLLLIAFIGYAVGPKVSRNTGKLIEEIPVLLNGLSTGDIATEVGEKYGPPYKNFVSSHSQGVTAAMCRLSCET